MQQNQLNKLQRELQELREELQALQDAFHVYSDHCAMKGLPLDSK